MDIRSLRLGSKQNADYAFPCLPRSTTTISLTAFFLVTWFCFVYFGVSFDPFGYNEFGDSNEFWQALEVHPGGGGMAKPWRVWGKDFLGNGIVIAQT